MNNAINLTVQWLSVICQPLLLQAVSVIMFKVEKQ